MMLREPLPDSGLATRDLTDTAFFHERLLSASQEDRGLPQAVAELFGAAPDERLSQRDWRRISAGYKREACGDMETCQADRHAATVFDALWTPPVPETVTDLVRRTEHLYGAAAADLSDLVIAFVKWALETGERQRASDLVFLARDAIPFFVVARQLKARGVASGRLSLLALNRTMMPRSPQEEAFPGDLRGTDVERFLAAAFATRQRPLLIDTGLYGTLIKPILTSPALPDPSVVFLASKNPHIAGYLNRVDPPEEKTDQSSLGPLSELCCDVLENWPKPYTRPCLWDRGGSWVAGARLTDPVSATAALVLYRTLAARARTLDLEALDPHAALQRFKSLSGPRFLTETLPRWPHADRWQAAWSHGSVSPSGHGLDRL
jgi:hypothetical protein